VKLYSVWKNIYLGVSNTLRNKLQTANKIPCWTDCSDLHYVNIGSKVQNIVFCFISYTLPCFDTTLTMMFEFILIAFISAPGIGLYFYFIRNFNFWKNLGVPYVKPVPFYLSMLKTVCCRESIFGNILRKSTSNSPTKTTLSSSLWITRVCYSVTKNWRRI